MSNTIRTQKTDTNGAPVFVMRDVVRTVSGGDVVTTRVQAPDMPEAGPHVAISNDMQKPAVAPAPSKEMDALAARVTSFLDSHNASRQQENVPAWQKSVDALRAQAQKLDFVSLNAPEGGAQLSQLTAVRSKTNGVA